MQRNPWLVAIAACAAFAACLDFDKFEGDAAATVAVSSTSTSTGNGGAAGAAGAPPVPPCDSQYGSAPGYAPCIENQAICEFRASIDGMSCADICASLGGECLDVFNDQPGCQHGSSFDCMFTDNQVAICQCSRGCGGDPPCESPDMCTAGACG